MTDKNYTHDDIRTECDEVKVGFITNIISQKGIPANFVPIPKSYPNKIFFREDGTQREWILLEGRHFFCVYCLCFSSKKKHRLILGVKYEPRCRMSEILKSHDKEKHHNLAETAYVAKATCDPERGKHRLNPDKWLVLKTVVKTIIFQATHG